MTSTINWHRLSYKRARSLILIMAISNIPAKISAGRMMEMSLPTFSNVSIKQCKSFSFLFVNHKSRNLFRYFIDYQNIDDVL